ncbi:hypothetical protein RIF29_21525 [Crotalaria pallida]|uniref:TIR domain-containing protein n=1 Tax=Crotalaria pallida TaxID=3830 RepID=A0AAN9F6T4_CROPI
MACWVCCLRWGGLLDDEDGQFLFAFAFKLRPCSIMHAELWGILVGMFLVPFSERGLRQHSTESEENTVNQFLTLATAMSSSIKLYDVFISFRGEDTRRNFTSHLHTALTEASIWTYTDDYLSKGHEVWPALCSAIENSHIAIVVFSRNYATSKWCLKELVKILECRKSRRLVVIPVFYRVDPSHIRKQTGSYGEAFAKHERGMHEKGNNNEEDVEKQVSGWKDALAEAANISGWDSSSRDYKNDSQLIKKIVKDVSEKRNLMSPYELEEEEDLIN